MWHKPVTTNVKVVLKPVLTFHFYLNISQQNELMEKKEKLLVNIHSFQFLL